MSSKKIDKSVKLSALDQQLEQIHKERARIKRELKEEALLTERKKHDEWLKELGQAITPFRDKLSTEEIASICKRAVDFKESRQQPAS